MLHNYELTRILYWYRGLGADRLAGLTRAAERVAAELERRKSWPELSLGQHIAISRDDSKMRIYRNGAMVHESVIDAVLFDRALTPDEVASLYRVLVLRHGATGERP